MLLSYCYFTTDVIGRSLCHVVNGQVDLPYVNKKTKRFWQKFKIMKYNILYTPSKVGVLVSIIFSHTPEEAMSGGLAKACVRIKN